MEYHLLLLLVCIPNSLQDFHNDNEDPISLSMPCEEGTSYPIAKNCRKYYKCTSGKIKLKTCPGIDEFSPVYKWCLPPNLARCWHPPKPQPTPVTCIIAPPTTSKPQASTNATTTKPSTSSKSTASVTSTFKTPTTAISDNATEVTEELYSKKVTSTSTDELLSTRSSISITSDKQSTYDKSTASVVLSSTDSSLTKTTPFETSRKTPDQWHTEITETTKISSDEISTLVFSTPIVSNNTIPFKTTISTNTIKDSTTSIFSNDSTPSSPGITKVSTRESSTEASELPTELSSTLQPDFVATNTTEVTSEEFLTTSGSSNPNKSPEASETQSTPSMLDKTTPTEANNAKNITSVTKDNDMTTVETTKIPDEDTTTENITRISKKITEQSAETKSLPISTTPSDIITEESSTKTTKTPSKVSNSETPFDMTTEATEVTSDEVSTTSGSSNPSESSKTSETESTPSILDKTTPTEAVNVRNITSVTSVGNWTTVETTKIPDEDTTTGSVPWITKKTTEQSAETEFLPISTTPSDLFSKESSPETTKTPSKVSSSETPFDVTTEVTEVTSEEVSTTSGSSNPSESPKTSETESTPSILDKTTPTEAVNVRNITSVTSDGNWTTVESSKIPDEDTATGSVPWITKKTTEQSAETKFLPISTTPSDLFTKESSTETTKTPSKVFSSETPLDVTTEVTEVTSEEVSTTSGSFNPSESPKTSETQSTPNIVDKTTPTEANNAKNITSVTSDGNWTTVKITKIPDEDTTTGSVPWITKKTTEQSAETKFLPISTTPSDLFSKESSTETTKSPSKVSSSETPFNVTTEVTEVTSEEVSTTSGSSNPSESSKTSKTESTPSILDKTTPTEANNAKNITSVTSVGNRTTVETTKIPDEDKTTESIPWISKKITERSAKTKSLPISTTPSELFTKESSTETTKTPSKVSSSETPFDVTTEANEVTSEEVSTISESSYPSESSETTETQSTLSILDKTTPTEAVNAKNITSVTSDGNFTTVKTTKISDEDTATENIPWTSKKTIEETASTKFIPVSTTNTPSENSPISSGTTNVFTKESSTESTQSPTVLSSSPQPHNVTNEPSENTSSFSTESSSCTTLSNKSEPSSVTILTTLETSAFTNHQSTANDKISTENTTKKDAPKTKSTPSESTSSNITNVVTKEIATKVTQSPETQGIDLSSTSSYTHSEETLPSSTQVSPIETISPKSENLTTFTLEYLTSSIKNEMSTDIGFYNISTLKPYSDETISTAQDNKKQPLTPDSLIKITTEPTTGNPTLNTVKTQRPITSSPNDSDTNVTSSSSKTATESSSNITSLIPERSSTSVESVTLTKISTLVSSPSSPLTSESYPNSLITSSEPNVNISTTSKFISSTESPTASPKEVCEEGHLYPDPSSCERYHFCFNGSLKQAYCPEYMEFSTLYHLCLPIPIAACSVSTSPSTTTTSQPTTELVEPSCTEGDRYPDPWSCQHYYLCENDSLVYETCPLSTLFSYRARSCMPSTSVQCLQLPTTTEKICIEPGGKTTNKTAPTGPVTDKVQPTKTTAETRIIAYTSDDIVSTLAPTMIDQGKYHNSTSLVTDESSTDFWYLSTISTNNFTKKDTTTTESITETDAVNTNTQSNMNNVTDKIATSETDSTTLKHLETTTPSDDYPEIVIPTKDAKKKTFKPKVFTIGPHESILDTYMCTDRLAYSNPNNCSKFYVCEGQKLVVKDCPVGEEFSEDEEKCLPAETAGCSNIDQDISLEFGSDSTELSFESRDAKINTPAQTQEGKTKNLIPDLADCRYYISCVNDNCVRTKCVDGEEFSPSELKCLPPKQAGCKKSPVFDNIFRDVCPMYQHRLTYHAYPEFCSYYYVCQYGKLYFFACPYGLEFSSSLLTCTSPSEANCTEQSRRRSNDKQGSSNKSSAKANNRNLNYHQYGYEHSDKNGYNKRDENSVKKQAIDNNRTNGNFFSRWVQNRRDFIEKFLF